MAQLSKRFVSNTRYFGIHCSSATHFFSFELPTDKELSVRTAIPIKFGKLSKMHEEIKMQYFEMAWQIRFEATLQLSQKHKMCHVFAILH